MVDTDVAMGKVCASTPLFDFIALCLFQDVQRPINLEPLLCQIETYATSPADVTQQKTLYKQTALEFIMSLQCQGLLLRGQ